MKSTVTQARRMTASATIEFTMTFLPCVRAFGFAPAVMNRKPAYTIARMTMMTPMKTRALMARCTVSRMQPQLGAEGDMAVLPSTDTFWQVQAPTCGTMDSMKDLLSCA
jgi:hypothetical protein